MVDVYLSSGHGRRPDGSYDPGAIATGGTEEHRLVERVTRVVDAALRRSGVAVVADECPDPRSGRSHAPNFYGSSVRAETSRPRVAVELHFDWRGAPRGGFGIYGSAYGHHLSDAIRARYRAAGLPVRAHQYRLLYFVRSTSMPAILWECDRVAAYPPEHLIRIGEAIAAGICDHLGATYQPPAPPPAPPDEEDTDMPIDVVTVGTETWLIAHPWRVPVPAGAGSYFQRLAPSEANPQYAGPYEWDRKRLERHPLHPSYLEEGEAIDSVVESAGMDPADIGKIAMMVAAELGRRLTGADE